MQEIVKVNLEDLCLQIIKERFNTYFTSKQLSSEVVASLRNISLRDVYFRRIHNDFRKKIRFKLSPLLNKFSKEGRIEKYSKLAWRKL